MGAPLLYEIYGEEGSQNGTIEDGGVPHLLSHYWLWAMKIKIRHICQQVNNLVKVQVGFCQQAMTVKFRHIDVVMHLAIKLYWLAQPNLEGQMRDVRLSWLVGGIDKAVNIFEGVMRE